MATPAEIAEVLFMPTREHGRQVGQRLKAVEAEGGELHLTFEDGDRLVARQWEYVPRAERPSERAMRLSEGGS